MGSHWIVGLTAAWMFVGGCGDGGPVSVEGGDADTATTEVPMDVPLDDATCFDAGGRLQVFTSPWANLELPEIVGAYGLAVGLVQHDEGLWALFGRTEEANESSWQVFGVELDEDGQPTQPAVPVDPEWGYRRVWQGPELALLAGCHDRAPGWNFVDFHGNPASASMTASEPATCDEALSVAWVAPDEALITWVDAARTCDNETSCVMLAYTSPGGIASEQSLHWAGFNGSSPNATIAAGSTTALVTMLRRQDRFSDDTELVITPVDLTGQPLAEPVALPLDVPPYPELSYRGTRTIADDTDGFFVFVGGLGASMGRLHVDAEARILEPMQELPVFETWPPGPYSQTYAHVFQTEFHGLDPRPWGSLARGTANHEGETGLELFVALDRRGEPISNLWMFPGNHAVAGNGSRNWTLTNPSHTAMRLVEFGCVLDE